MLVHAVFCLLCWGGFSFAVPLPVVLWHGMGDSCCDPNGIGLIKKAIEDETGAFVYSIATGPTATKDIWSSFFGNVNQQVAVVCEELQQVRELKNGFNAIGFSQGGQFLRAVVERCQHEGLHFHTLITMGSQHQGIMNIPECCRFDYTSAEHQGDAFCRTMQLLMSRGIYVPFLRNNIVPAQYFKSPYDLENYFRYNSFLPDINNERAEKDHQYKDNFSSLKRLVLFMFTEDTVVVPKESAWFGFFNGQRLLTMNETDLYLEDFIGLKSLDDAGRLELRDAPGQHMQFQLSWFVDNVVKPYLAA